MSQKKPFFKGLRGFTRADNDILARDVSDSIYRWWWEFMRLSPVFWFARTTGIEIQDVEVRRIYELVGDLEENGFSVWWIKTGKFIFREEVRPAKVNLINLDTLDQHNFSDESLYLDIPLSITKETIIKQIKKLLNERHEGRKLNVARTTTAQLKLHTKRYRLLTIENEYWVLLYKLIYPKIEIWRIGDRLRIRRDMKLRSTERRDNDNMFRKMSSVVGRFLYKANFSMQHIHYGSFPNINKMQTEFFPFGKKNHADFISNTTGDNCLYNQWLKDKFADKLHNRIISKNNLDRFRNNPANKIWEKIPKFIAGETDYLDVYTSGNFGKISSNS